VSDVARQPLFASIADVACRLGNHSGWPGLEELNRLARLAGIVNLRGVPLRFVPQVSRRGQRDYETGILATGEIPTRPENWHDLFNALVWLAFPRTKAALNAVQCRCLQRNGRGNRPPLSDAATLFDESGLILVARDDELAGLLRAHRWREAFLTRRAAWREVRVCLFGHALLEKSLAPFPAMTAKCLCLHLDPLPPADTAPKAEVDAAVASVWLDGAVTRPADLFPLPVLGIPGLWPENEDPDFYADRSVFRSRSWRPYTLESGLQSTTTQGP
jgi:hypothetical protein